MYTVMNASNNQIVAMCSRLEDAKAFLCSKIDHPTVYIIVHKESK
jgi:hypothetical protein